MTQNGVMTVVGPVAPDSLGIVLPHEHVLIDCQCFFLSQPEEVTLRALAQAPVDITNLGFLRRSPMATRDNWVMDDLELAIAEITDFRNLGGKTIVDVTLPDIGRDPMALQIASRATGLNIIAGCGHYVYAAHPPTLEDESIDAVAERLVKELTEGIGSTGVRAGIIGEIGTSHPLHPREDKVLRAAARAQHATGVAITVHCDPGTRAAHSYLDILDSEGADLAKVVLGHLDCALGHPDIDFDAALAFQRSLAERGCYIEYDTVGDAIYVPGVLGGAHFWLPSDDTRARGIAELCRAGYVDQILISQDVCKKIDLMRYGGFGYGHILRHFVSNLRDMGLDQATIDTILIKNPLEMLTPKT